MRMKFLGMGVLKVVGQFQQFRGASSDKGGFLDFTVICERERRGQMSEDFIDCTTYSEHVMRALDTCKPGDLVELDGYIESYSYTDKNGKVKSVIKLNARNVQVVMHQLATGRATSAPVASAAPRAAPAPQPAPNPDDDLPF